MSGFAAAVAMFEALLRFEHEQRMRESSAAVARRRLHYVVACDRIEAPAWRWVLRYSCDPWMGLHLWPILDDLYLGLTARRLLKPRYRWERRA